MVQFAFGMVYIYKKTLQAGISDSFIYSYRYNNGWQYFLRKKNGRLM